MASQKTILDCSINNLEAEENILEWLRSKKIPLASSCNGDGVCLKCLVNKEIIACQTKMLELADQQNRILIEIAYL